MPHIPDQQYCSKKKCQNKRRQDWRRRKLSKDPDYKADQYDAQKRWRDNHPDYWKRYRSNHPDYVEKNREQQKVRNQRRKTALLEPVPQIAKRYALNPDMNIKSGTYALSPIEGDKIAKRYALLVDLNVITDGYMEHRPQLE